MAAGVSLGLISVSHPVGHIQRFLSWPCHVEITLQKRLKCMSAPPRSLLDDLLAGHRLTEEEAVFLFSTHGRAIPMASSTMKSPSGRRSEQGSCRSG